MINDFNLFARILIMILTMVLHKCMGLLIVTELSIFRIIVINAMNNINLVEPNKSPANLICFDMHSKATSHIQIAFVRLEKYKNIDILRLVM